MIKSSLVFLYCVVFILFFPFIGQALVLTADIEIVNCGKETPQQKMAVSLLQEVLSEMFGGPVPITPEGQHKPKGSAIFVGQGALAAQNGIDSSRFGEEELLVKALPGGKVLLAGGVRGIYYAATEFLELAGCRFYSIDARHIPHCKKLRLDDGLNVQRSPFFKMRSCYIGGSNERFYIWNKQNGEYLSACLEEAVVGKAHSMTDLSAKFPEHVFALNENGKRCPGPSGQLCFSSPEARRLMKDSVAATIEKSNRERTAKGLPKAKFFRISQNDNNVRCQCSECRALVEKYGSESGLLLDFINEIAASFPDLNIVTFAYRFTRYPPRPGSIKAAPNVMIQIALQSLEWGDGETRNLLLPWSDRRNDEARKLIEDWGNFATMFQVWDYGRFYQQAQAVPYTCLKAILGNMPFYARNKIQAYLKELPMDCQRFVPLRSLSKLTAASLPKKILPLATSTVLLVAAVIIQ